MGTRRAAAALIFVCALAAVSPAQRLLTEIQPEHYELHFAPDLSTGSFEGQARITVRLAQPSTTVTLNAADIEFLSAAITSSAGRTLQAQVSLEPAAERATLTVPDAIPAGRAVIAISYKGRLNDELRGFYRSRANGREYAVTQMEPTDARRAFPSFDEPSMKATFAISATIDTRDSAISNGRTISDTPGPAAGKHTVKFSTTKRMSTYLVALFVGDWECVEGQVDRIPVRVCGIPGRSNHLGFALESAEQSLRYFNRYFAIRYPFEKLDIVAAPDFSAGAMENTAAILFREQFLLIDPQAASTEQRKQVFQFVAHEIAHQWFGDLVTPRWWDDIWLNEGFATWMERRPMQEWKPEWTPHLEEVRDTQGAMTLDSMRTTRPIRMQVDTPDQIGQVFDAIAYQKTAAVVRMIEGYVGPQSYREGVNAYLKKFAYANATGEGFWTTIADATGKPIDRIMSSFVTQGGMPLVSVSSSCSSGTTELSLAQRPVSSTATTAPRWEIPICYKRARNGKVEPVACTLLSNEQQTTKLQGCSDWVFANAESRGYYRTAYGPDDLKALAGALNRNELLVTEQTALLGDVWAQVRMNQESISSFLGLSAGLAKAGQPNAAVLTLTDGITFISNRLLEPDMRPAFQKWVRQTLGPAAARLGWDPDAKENDETKRIRAAVLGALGNAGRDPDVLREARRRVDAHLDATKTLDPSLVVTALQLAALQGDQRLYERYLAQAREGATAIQKIGYLNSLGFFEDPVLRQRTLDYAISSEVRSQEAPGILGTMMAQPVSTADAWAHIKKHWSTLERTLDVFQAMPALVRSTENFCNDAARNDVERFFEEHRVGGSERSIRQAIENIDRCAAIRTEQAQSLASFLKTSTGN